MSEPPAGLLPLPYERVDCIVRGMPCSYFIEKKATSYVLYVKRGKQQPYQIFDSETPFGLVPQLGSEMPRIVPYYSGEVTLEHLHTSLIFLQDNQIAMRYSDIVKIKPQTFTGKQILEAMSKFSSSDLRRHWAPLLVLSDHVVVRFDANQELTLQEFLTHIYTAIGEIEKRWKAAWEKPYVKRRLWWAKQKEMEYYKAKVDICHIDYDYLIKELMNVPNDELIVDQIGGIG